MKDTTQNPEVIETTEEKKSKEITINYPEVLERTKKQLESTKLEFEKLSRAYNKLFKLYANLVDTYLAE